MFTNNIPCLQYKLLCMLTNNIPCLQYKLLCMFTNNIPCLQCKLLCVFINNIPCLQCKLPCVFTNNNKDQSEWRLMHVSLGSITTLVPRLCPRSQNHKSNTTMSQCLYYANIHGTNLRARQSRRSRVAIRSLWSL